MAIRYLTNLNLSQNELQNAVIQQLSSDPEIASSIQGQIYYNTTDNVLRLFNGTIWEDVGSGGGGSVDYFTVVDGTLRMVLN